VSSLRRAYPRGYASLERAIIEMSGRIDLPSVTDVEVHADRLRLSSFSSGAVAEISFDLAGITPRGGAFDFALDHARQTIFLFSDDDADLPAHSARQRLSDLLRRFYWLIEGAKEPGADLLLLGMPGIREFLAGILGRAELRTIHHWIRAAAQAVSQDQDMGASEFALNVRRASNELRCQGVDPELQRALDNAAEVAIRLRRGVLPVLAIRRVSRHAILRGLSTADADCLRRTFAKPESIRLLSAHAVSADSVAHMDAHDLLALVGELRECEFFAIFLADRAAPARYGSTNAIVERDEASVPTVVAPDTLRECTKLAHSLSRANAFLFSREESRRTGRFFRDYLPNKGRGRQIAGFFPGLGSRVFYQNRGRDLLDSGVPEVAQIYQEAARALGFPDQPERLLLIPENMPTGRLAAQGFIGAALLVHSLAVEAHLRATAAKNRIPVHFVAYTGESFGIITAAAASGAISVGDGVKLGRAFTPLMLAAADAFRPDDPLAQEMKAYLPASLGGRNLVPEPYHVIGLRGDPANLAEILADIAKLYPKTDVEVHKLYSRRQTNVYVRAGAKLDFDLFAAKYPAVETAELKEPTTFLAHAERMSAVREAFERFMTDNGIVFHKPHTPVVSNNNSGLLTTATEVRNGILAITDEIMASQATVETLDSLRPDAIVELGLGSKSVQLLIDNNVGTPVTSYAGIVAKSGDAGETSLFLRAMQLVDALLGDLENLHVGDERVTRRHYHTLRGIFRFSAQDSFCERYFYRTIGRAVVNEILHRDRLDSSAFYQLLDIYQHTYSYRDHIDVGAGELVLQARLKKRLFGNTERLGQAYAELKVIDGSGVVNDRSLIFSEQPEMVVLHFDRLPGLGHADLAGNTRLLLDTQPLAHQIYDHVSEYLSIEDDGFLTLTGITATTGDQLALSYLVYQYALFQLLRLHRPALFLRGYHLAGSDPMGWLVALAVSGAAALPDVVRLFRAYLPAGMESDEAKAALDRMLASLVTPDVPIISPEGTALQAKNDLEAATRAVFTANALDTPARRIRLTGNCQLLCLGSALDPAHLDTGPFRTKVISVLSPTDIWRERASPALDDFEFRSTLSLTAENIKVLHHARDRNLLSSTVYAYIDAGETIVGFGKGGSESMTIFVKKEGDDRIIVRKILSEALTTAKWSRHGQGVMLPPFAKAKNQAEYLKALPESVRPYFPEAFDSIEREIPVLDRRGNDDKTIHNELIYEMSYVPGQEVSRFIEKHCPPPAVIARLYVQVLSILNRAVHQVNRVPAPGRTLDISYLRKIEDRLALCRRTAPRTFSEQLLDTEHIMINGVRYLNSSALLTRLREHPEIFNVLEPRFHSLVMGDTNTENIKVTNVDPLLRAQRLIESDAPAEQIDTALAAITAESLGIRFLDPRAIGFCSTGRQTRDDPMYDNKPWHNSIGHYDEIHHEHFTLQVHCEAGRTPGVDIEFTEGNRYQQSYRVRDLTVSGGQVDNAAPRGMEDYFGPVMTEVYGLDDPDSAYCRDDPYWLIRFVFIMGTHFTAMPPFHFQPELDGTLIDNFQVQRRPVAIYCEGVKWLNWALEMLDGRRTEFLGLPVPPPPGRTTT
jgi:malonyl CoA-acyl carrier protein transacylase